MDIFNLNLNNNGDDKNKNLDSWFDFMNSQFKKIEEMNEKNKINNLLIDNDINPIK